MALDLNLGIDFDPTDLENHSDQILDLSDAELKTTFWRI